MKFQHPAADKWSIEADARAVLPVMAEIDLRAIVAFGTGVPQGRAATP